MHIEINTAGIGGAISINEYQSNISSFISHTDDIISCFKTIERDTYNLSGGTENLNDALDNVATRIREEEEKKNEAITVQKKTNDFVSLAKRVDSYVADVVTSNKEEFYKTNPWARPSTLLDDTNKWFGNAWEWICCVGEDIGDGLEAVWDWTKDTATKVWNGLVDFYNEHKKIIDTVLLVVGAIAAIATVMATGGGALVFLLGALGCSASVAAAISGAVAVVAVVSTVAATTLNVIDVWAEIDNSSFEKWKSALNITSGVSNLLYSIGSIYNSFKHISPEQAKNAMKTAFSKNRGAYVDGQYVTFLSDYQAGADSAINRELLTDRSVNHFYAYDNPNGGKIYVSADPCTGSGIANVVGNSSDEFIVISGTHGGPNGGLSFNDSYNFFQEDYNFFKNFPNVKVINIQDHIVSLNGAGMTSGYNHAYLKSLMDSGKNIICAWCYSDRSILVKELLGLIK